MRARIPIGRDGRNRPSLFPFGTATGRNAQAKSLFNAHAVDALVHEVSGRQDRALSRLANPGSRRLRRRAAAMRRWRKTILRGDIYHALAQDVRPDQRHRHQALEDSESAAQRQRMKALQLGINYGMGVRSLSRGLDRHPLIASEVIIRHQRQLSDVLGVARRHGRSAPCWSA